MAACAALLCAAATVSCEDVFETDTTTVVFEKDNQLQSPNDSLYSVMGILSQVQKLGEKYVLLGELRGDLMTTTFLADEDMQDLAAFRQSESSSFRSYSDFYNVINNCNYAITRMNTDVAPYGEKLMVPEYAQIKVLRAWTYLQLALARGDVYWLERPVMNFEESTADYPMKNIEQVADALIADLEPYADVRPLDYGTIDRFDSRRMFIPVRLLLGDLYLLRGHYEEAVRMYARYIGDNTVKLSLSNVNAWGSNRLNSTGVWNNSAGYAEEEIASLYYSSNPNAYHPRLVRWTYNKLPFLLSSENFVDEMATKDHLFAPSFGTPNPTTRTFGDLRGQAVTLDGKVVAPGAYGEIAAAESKISFIYKYRYSSFVVGNAYDPANELFPNELVYTSRIPLYRAPHVWLRFAEALNRMGKPSLAYTILKYGLRRKIVENTSIVSPEDLTFLNNLGVDFTSENYNDNIGSFTRGCGWGILEDNTVYVIPDYTRYVEVDVTDPDTGDQTTVTLPSVDAADIEAARADSILFVEDNIVNELAAETCFEGNRFFDLYRVAAHRNQFPAYMAKKVSARFGSKAAAMESLLSQRSAWFIK